MTRTMTAFWEWIWCYRAVLGCVLGVFLSGPMLHAKTAIAYCLPGVASLFVVGGVSCQSTDLFDQILEEVESGKEEQRSFPPGTILASAVIVNRRGLMVTSAHALGEKPCAIVAVLHQGQTLSMVLVGQDRERDLALLMPQEPLPKTPLAFFPYPAASLRLSPGDPVFALGNLCGFPQSVTKGVISGIGRRVSSNPLPLIQTDAPLGPGSSGGALLTEDGVWIGLVTAVFAKEGGALGVGFAIPVADVKAFVRAHDPEGSPA